MRRILIVVHDKTAPQGLIDSILARHDITPQLIDITTDVLPEPGEYEAIIGLGGSQHVYEVDRYPYFAAEKIWLQHIVQSDIPYLGICLGGQLLAAALDGQVKRHHQTEVGFFDVPLTREGQRDPLFQGLPEQVRVFHWHEDIFDLPDQAILLATHTSTINQAFRYGRRAYGLQFHIEVDQPIVQNWLKQAYMDTSIRQELGLPDSQYTIEKEWEKQFPVYHQHTIRLFENFLALSHPIT